MTYFRRSSTVRIQSMIALGLAALALSACESAQGTTAHSLGAEVETTFYSLVEGEKQGPGTVSIIDVRPGEVAELVDAGFDLDVDAGTASVLYVDVGFTNDGDVPVDLREPSAIDADGNFFPSLTVIDLGDQGFDLCPALPDTLEPGAAAEGCSIVLVPDSVAAEQISYLADTSEDFVYWEVR